MSIITSIEAHNIKSELKAYKSRRKILTDLRRKKFYLLVDYYTTCCEHPRKYLRTLRHKNFCPIQCNMDVNLVNELKKEFDFEALESKVNEAKAKALLICGESKSFRYKQRQKAKKLRWEQEAKQTRELASIKSEYMESINNLFLDEE